MLRKVFKKVLFYLSKRITIDLNSELNYSVINNSKNKKYPCRIYMSDCNLQEVNEGCNISQVICSGNVWLGRFVSIMGPGTVIKSLSNKITIGNFSSVGQNVCIYDFSHSFEKLSSSMLNYLIFKESFRFDISSKGHVIIEEDVWIGSNTVILPGVKIGRGAIIGAGSVVTKDVPRYSVAFGNPAIVHNNRFDDRTIQYLEDLEWWNWSIEKIKANRQLFNVNLRNNDFENFKTQKTNVK